MLQSFDISSSAVHDGRIGIIDIGSNSIRLVIYDQLKRSPVPIYNEKVMCALGRGLASSGVLNPDGLVMAKETLKRLIAMGRNMEISLLHVMATAAVRDAKDGAAFKDYIEKTYDITVDVISGEKEAKLGAYGICASVHRPEGITCDMGGGSLELVRIDGGLLRDQASVPLGSLRMLDEAGSDRAKLEKLIEKRLSGWGWLEQRPSETFYAIGGSFRALAKMHLHASDYPLRILHEYTAPTKPFLKFLREVAGTPEDKLAKQPGLAAKRAEALPGAALVLARLLEMSRAEAIVFSTSGIREGYLYDKLSLSVRNQDGLLASCTEFATKSGRTTAYAHELFTWMSPLLPAENEARRRLRFAYCLLSDIALHIHPEYRAEWAYHRILYSALTGLSHRERVALALALYYRYHAKFKAEWPSLTLIDECDRAWARLIGAAANLAYHLSGSTASNLPKTSLVPEGKTVRLDLSGDMRDVAGEAVAKRLDVLAEAYKAYVKYSAVS